MRIELTLSAWKAEVLPLNYIRTLWFFMAFRLERFWKMERKTRFVLATLALARRCSTPEPLPHITLVEGGGFEPPKAQLTDLQSAPFGHSGIPRKKWSWWRESNPQPADYKSAALPLSHISVLATGNGLEPSTSSVTGWHSNQLNYPATMWWTQ